jgi:hypothetical protein
LRSSGSHNPNPLLIWARKSVPSDQGPFYSCIGSFPKKFSLDSFDGFEYTFGRNKGREEIERNILENIFEEDKMTNNIQSSKGPTGEIFI